MKIIELLLTMRKFDDDLNKFTLDQTRFINLLMCQWGGEKSTAEIVDNDKLRVFGLIMSIERDTYILQQLSEGVIERVHIDSPEYAPKVMFQNLALDFSNELLYVKLPSGPEDMDDYDELNANDSTQMQIMRDGNWIKNVYATTLTEYKEYLSNWNKGTGGGLGLSSKFETWSQDKLDKYDIDPTIYDHTNVKNRPSILMEGYTKKKMYLTVMFMWDKKLEFILSAKYDPLKIERGEDGLAREENNEDVSMSGMSSLCSKTSKRSSLTKA